ncbi:type II toxin-antitoxin system prevent-host-death family antitoxin [bacterium endosymbiont of Escarpia laminata]|nr:MAG: type II toxin-antitoxin system prevent-host-death family antitoxin [bacterium endosymbiont of Escarpia laminata]
MKEQTIKASEFKAKCLQLMDEVSETGKEIIITKNGRPVSKMVPIRKRPKTLFGGHKDQITVKGDIIEPLDVEWDAMQ